MTFAIAWLVLPLLLAALSLGCGLLLETVSGMQFPGALLLPAGFVVISLATQFPHMSDTTARLQTPLVVVLSLTGYGLSRPWKRFQLDRWLAGSVAAVYAVFAAPVVLSGQATFLGYIKLDDTALYQAILDRAAAHGYDVGGLPPGTFDSVLTEGYKFGYPLGSLLPLGVGHTLLRVDTLWLWQPYLTFLAVLTALGLYQLASGLVQSRALRACVAVFGAQAALMYGYALWGGVKELFVPGVVLFAACLIPKVRTGGPRQVIPLAAASAAVIGGLSVGGGIWLVPVLAIGVTLLLMSRPLTPALDAIGVYIFTAGFLAIPILSVSFARLHHIGKFMKGGSNGQGNLPHSLSWWQPFGIWPGGDFRFGSSYPTLTHLLAALVGLGAIYAVYAAWQRRRWEIVAVFATAAFSCLIYGEVAGIWVAGKSFAVSSPLVLGVGLLGVAVLVEGRRQTEGAVAMVVLAGIAAAVLWSNATQYHSVLLAPSSRLMELEQIGQKFSGDGPTLLTEYEPYAARHFLRGLAAVETSELGPGQTYPYLRPGESPAVLMPSPPSPPNTAITGSSPDVDEIQLKQLLYYHTLIIRRTGVASTPPSVYTLRWSGRYYDVWREDPTKPAIIKHLSLGTRFQPAAVPDCKAVMDLARVAADAHGSLATVYRPHATVIEPDGRIGVPKQYIYDFYGEPVGLKHGKKGYTLKLPFTVATAGTYGVWVGGSFSSTLSARVDGHRTGRLSNQTEWPGNFLNFGSVYLSKGQHTLGIKHSGPDFGPGSAAPQPFGLGPFVIAQGTDDRPVVSHIKPADARKKLCGKSLDWIEALRGR